MNNKLHHKTVILTGGMGGFGRFLSLELLKNQDIKLILLIRANSIEEAQIRAKKVLGNWDNNQVEVLCSDLTKEKLGLSEADYANLASKTTHILHAAASVRFTLSIEEARKCNVKTTEQMINFAKQCPNLVRFGFVSTALVAGNRSGIVTEDEFEHTAGFKNTYEQTKYEAEKLVRTNLKKFPVVIFRPPLIISSSAEGYKGHTNLLKLVIFLVKHGWLPFIPGTKNSTIDIIDGEDAAGIICKLLLKENLQHMTYHITNGYQAPTIKTIHAIIEKKLGASIPLEYCGSINSFNQRVRKIPWYKFKLKISYKRSASFLPEAAYPKIFNNHNTLSELNISKVGKDPNNILRLII